MHPPAHMQTPPSVPSTKPLALSPLDDSSLSTSKLALEPLNSVPHAATRIAALDMLRGIALLGILLVNIYSYGSLYPYLPLSQGAQSSSDFWLGALSSSLFEGRFISLFAMLFGAGLVLQAQKLGDNAYPHMAARMKALLLIGLVHGFFIWPGDILTSYALSALVVWHYQGLTPMQKWQKGWLFFHIAMLVLALLALTPRELPSRDSLSFILIYQQWSGSLVSQLIANAEYMGWYLLSYPLSTLWLTAGLILMGQSLLERGYFEHGFTRQQVISSLAMAMLLSAVAIILNQASSHSLQALAEVVIYYAALPTAYLYIHVVATTLKPNSWLGRTLANIGRLALSLYLLQSMIASVIFRHLAPQWQLTFDRQDYLMLAIAMILLQIWLANAYLTRFAIGPAESLWRSLSVRFYSRT